jgi:hypothetical protein
VIQMSVQPARAGTNEVHLYFFDQAGATVPIDAVEMTAAVGDVPPRRLTVVPVTPSHFSSYDATLTPPGLWRLVVTAVRRGQALTETFEVPIR